MLLIPVCAQSRGGLYWCGVNQVKTHSKAIFMSTKHGTQASTKSKKTSGSKGRTGALKDTRSQDLLTDAHSLGNNEMQRQLKSSQQHQGALIDFILERLAIIRNLQLKENDLLKSRNEWFIAVHRGSEALPDPGRWKPAAEQYKKAALALSRGDISRGIQLLKTGENAESDARKSLPQSIGSVAKQEKIPTVSPDSAHQTAPCDPPQGLVIADRIINLVPHVADASTRKKSLHDWLSTEAEEDEENEDDNAD